MNSNKSWISIITRSHPKNYIKDFKHIPKMYVNKHYLNKSPYNFNKNKKSHHQIIIIIFRASVMRKQKKTWNGTDPMPLHHQKLHPNGLNFVKISSEVLHYCCGSAQFSALQPILFRLVLQRNHPMIIYILASYQLPLLSLQVTLPLSVLLSNTSKFHLMHVQFTN